MNKLIINGSIALLITASTFAGTPTTKPEAKKPNPLSFADGLFTVGFEARSNNRDFAYVQATVVF